MALAVTCLLSLIPMKIPAISPFMGGAGGLSGPEGPLSFWGHDAALHAPEDGVASSDDHLRTKASRRPARFGGRRNLPLLSALDPLAPQSWNGSFGERFSLSGLLGLYAGIRANPRIPVKRVRQIALPPPTPFNLRAPPAQA
jgi:hypothetical protein